MERLPRHIADPTIETRIRTMEPSEAWTHGWEAAELMQLRRDAACSFRENLIWLEEMHEFARDFARMCLIKGPGFSKALPKK
jgi:hypothetical protein